MVEPQYVECNPSRAFTPSTFLSGSLEIPFNVGVPNGWVPSKSYVRIGLTLNGSTANSAPVLREMIALADNVGGNLFSNAYIRAQGQSNISQCTAGLDRASALCARLEHGNSWLNSLGAGSSFNVAKFCKRNEFTAADISPDAYLGAENEMYRPTSAGNFATAQVTYTAAGGGIVGNNTLFQTGMPSTFTGAPTGSSVAIGDILVIQGIYYPVTAVGGEFALTVGTSNPNNVGPTSSWYIIRKDMLRAPQAKNIVYVNWQPPLGIFKHTGYLGGGDYQLVLQPNSQYLTAAVESKNIDALTGTLPYSLNVNSVKLYIYVEKVQIPPNIQELPLLEYQVQSKPWQPNLQFEVSPYTESLTFFVQDNSASYDPRVPPSMFKCNNNSDLQLTTIQCSYAGFTKPDIPWVSNFYGIVSTATSDSFQQRYLSSYEESGSDMKLQGCETYTDFLVRGPFYHFAFIRDKSYRATSVSLNTSFSGSGVVNGGPTSINGQPADIYCISHFRTSCQITTAAGRIVSAQMIGEV